MRIRPRLRRIGTPRGWLLAAGILAVTAAVCGAVLLVWRGPWWFDGKYLDTEELRSGSAALVTGFRTAVVQLLAILGAGIALVFTAINYRLTRRGQVTERFTKALERLGSEHLYVRYGGIVAMEQIIKDAPEQTGDAMRVLAAFVRERSPKVLETKPVESKQTRISKARRAAQHSQRATPRQGPAVVELPSEPDPDVQFALTVLTLPRTPRAAPLDLSGLHLAGVKLVGADLTGANLQGADLAGALFNRADLLEANLQRTNLTGANLDHADLIESLLDGANLTKAWLDGANLLMASLDGANLTAANLNDASLTGATLYGTDLTGTNLTRAELGGARLSGANLTYTNFDQAQLYAADLSGTDLTRANGLSAQQVLGVRDIGTVILPDRIAADPQVVEARKRSNESESE